MKKVLPFSIVLLLTVVFSFPVKATGIYVSGSINANTVWQVDTVYVTGDVLVQNGVVLSINPGVVVYFKGHYHIDVKGSIQAIGNVNDTIYFTPENKVAGWKGIRFNSVSTTNAFSHLHYCRIEFANATGGYPANAGGGIGIINYSRVEIRNSRISNNTATYGGGIGCESNSSPMIINNLICNNRASAEGGGMNIYSNSNPTIIGNVIVNNTNIGSRGGGLHFFNSTSLVSNNTIANNIGGQGGGVYFGNNSNIDFVNNIVWGNTTPTASHNVYNGATNAGLTIRFCNIQGGIAGFAGAAFGGTSSNVINSNPLFFSPTVAAGNLIPAATADFSLNNGTPCYNTGTNDTTGLGLPDKDISQLDRVRNGRVDIGAYEYVTVLCGSITGNQTVSDLVRVKCEVLVTSAGVLTINPGTTLEFAPGTFLNVQGRVVAVGSLENKIRFKPMNEKLKWRGIRFTATAYPVDSSKFEHCIVTYAHADGPLTTDRYGGAFYINACSRLLIRNSIISNNYAFSWGGGFYVNNASPAIINNLIVNNQASFGAGLYLHNNCSPLIINNTIAYNNGHGIRNTSGATSTISNNIIYGNITGLLIAGSPTITYNCVQGGYSGTGNISSNPQFKNPPAGVGINFDGLAADFDIDPASPVINAGNPSTAGFHLPTEDLAGRQRLLGTVDMGCYEYVSSMNACGTISSNTIWNTNYVLVTCNITINSGVTLTINPGTIVEFQGNYTITCSGGAIRAIGSPTDSVYFRASNPSVGWGGIRIHGASADSSIFDYCSFTHSKIATQSSFFNNFVAAITIQSNSRVRIDRSTFFENSSTHGGSPSYASAVFTYLAHISIKNSVFFNNNSQNFGGAICIYYSNTKVNNCIFRNNSSATGAAVYLVTSATYEPEISNSILVNNTASSNGGAIYMSTGNLEIKNCLIANNQAARGGGIYSTSNNDPRIINTTIARNRATSQGGGFYLNSNSDAELYNCILWGNEATTAGDQMFINDLASDPKIYYSLIDGGKDDFEGTGSGIEYQGVYQNNIDADPLFISPTALSGTAGNAMTADFRLQDASPCVNSGMPNINDLDLPARDLDGNNRLYNGIIDMGAYENQNPVLVCGTISSNTTWIADTIFVNCNIVINDENVTLTIKPGTVVSFMDNYKIIIQRGNIVAEGTPDRPITFTVTDTTGFADATITDGGWGGISFPNTYNFSDSSKFSFCNFYYGKSVVGSLNDRRGGAVYIYNFNKIRFSNCKFINNMAENAGGAVYCESSSPAFVNNLFAHNSTTASFSYGGAIEFRDASSLLMNNTFTYNYAGYLGGAFSLRTSYIMARNNVFWGNECSLGSYYANFYITSGGSNSSENNIIQGSTGNWSVSQHINRITSDPLFVSPLTQSGFHPDAINADYCVANTSPAINAGNNTGLSGLGSQDLKGNTRHVAGTLDIGAYEVQLSPSFITSQPAGISVCMGLSASLTVNAEVSVSYQWQKDGINIAGANSSTYAIPLVTIADSGFYSCIMSNEFGSVFSDTVAIDVKIPPIILQNPTAKEACAGQSASMVVEATGTEPVSYQWYSLSGIIPGAIDDTLILSNVGMTNASSYYAIITNECGLVSSIPATLTVNTPVAYSSQSGDATACPGQSTTFSVTNTGTIPYTYQWYKKSATPSLVSVGTGTVTNSHTSYPAPYGNYYWGARHQFIMPASEVIAAGGGAGAITSLAFNVATVRGIPLQGFSIRIGSTPLDSFSNTLFVEGLQTVYSVPLYTETSGWNTHEFDTEFNWDGVSNLIVEVCFNNTSWTGNASVYQTSTSYPSALYRRQDAQNVCTQSTGVRASQRPNMRLGITTALLIPTATNNILNLNAVTQADEGYYFCITSNMCGTASSNDMNLSIKSLPQVDAASGAVSECVGANAVFTVSASGTEPITYQWYKASTAIPGASSPTLQLSNIQSSDEALYSCRVTNECGYVNSIPSQLTVLSPVSYASQSGNTSSCNGGPASFSVTAAGSTPITYQWYNSSGAIANATNNSYTIASSSQSHAGNYYCIATNTCGSQQSSNMVLTVNTVPQISSESGNTTRCVGQSTLFSISASSDLSLTYQWYKDLTPITHANAASYLIGQTQTSDAGVYKCRITNTCGYVESSNMALSVDSAVVITSQSGDSVKCLGTTMQFFVQGVGSQPISYQWHNNAGPIVGATSASYTIPIAGSSHAGVYYCVVGNNCGNVQSTSKTLSISNPPAITMQPSSAQVCIGQGAGFSVTATGTAPLEYQWYKDGNPIQGAVTSSLTMNNVQLSAQGNYFCVIKNACDSVISSTANLSVDAGVSFTAQSGGVNVCNASAATFSVTATGTPPITYQWYDHNGAIANATNNTYTINSVTASDAGNYYCIATNHCSSVQTANMALTVNTIPAITYESGDEEKCVGQSALYSLVANSNLALSYQWFKGATSIQNANSSSYMISSVSSAHIGQYRCRVTNACGYVESNNMNLSVNNPVSFTAQSGDSTVCLGSSMQFYAQAAGTAPISYQWYNNSGIIAPATSSTYMIPSVGQSSAGAYYCIASNICGSAQSTTKNLSISNPPSFTQHPASVTVCTGQAAAFTVAATGAAPLSYQWFRNSDTIPGATQPTLSLNNIQNSQAGAYHCAVSNPCGSVQSNVAILTVDTSVIITAQSGSVSGCTGSAAFFSVTASGTAPISYQWYNNNGAISGANNNTYTVGSVTASDAGDFYCVVSNVCATVQSSVKTLNVNVSPVISQQPVNTQTCSGQSTLLTITASGSHPLSYQWYKNSQAISGAINSMFLINSVTAADSGQYYCEVSNACGTISSNVINLSVKTPVTIINQSADSIRCERGQMTFSVHVGGSEPLTYQWYKNNALIPGADTAIYSLTNLNIAQSGFYQAIISNVCGSVASSYKNLSVFPRPNVSLGNDTSFCHGQSVLLSPGPGYSCVWSNGSLSPQLLVTSSANYFVHVTDANGCTAISDTVNINVIKPFEHEEVCIVSVDSATGKNVVAWEKTYFSGIASYKVYKESTVTGVYNLVDIKHVDSMSVYLDFSSNPGVKSDRYRISVVDTCGNESPMSIPHKTMHLTVNQGPGGSWNLIWDKYEGFNVPTYRIWRADSTKNFVLIDSVQGTAFTYSDLGPPPGGLYYEVEVVKPGGACIATSADKAATSYNSSRSNQADNGLITLTPLHAGFFAFPATGMRPLTVQFYDDSEATVSMWMWDFGDGNTSNMMNPLHIYDTVGVFTVTLNVSDGSGASANITRHSFITVFPVGVEDYELNPEFVIAPNPFTDETNLRFSIFEDSDVKIEIYGVRGELISVAAEGRFSSGTYVFPFNTANTPYGAGVYIVRFTAGNKVVNHRMVKVR